MINKKILLPSKRFKNSDTEDLTIPLGLDRSETLLREGDKTIILDIAELFSKERNESTKYRLYGKMNMIFRNEYVGIADYVPLRNSLYLTTDIYDEDEYSGYMPYDEFAFLRRDYVREVSNPTGSTVGDYESNIILSGNTDHQSFGQMEAPFKNWNLYVTYVFDNDEDYPMKYTLSGNTVFNYTAFDGIPFRVSEYEDYYELTSPVPHNMSQGEYVVLSGSTISGGTEIDRIFNISSVGNETFNSEKYVINLTKSEFTSLQNIGGVVFGRRCIDKKDITNTISKYYVRKHKTLTTTNDYIMDNAGFETPLFEVERKLQFETADGRDDILVVQNRPETILYHFKETIDINGLRNNLGYTPTEVFLTTVFRNGNGYFNYPPRHGWRFNFHDTWIDEQFDMTNNGSDSGLPSTTYTNSGVTFTVGEELSLGTVIDGDFVEYNEVDFKETVISESFHKISVNTDAFDHDQTDGFKYIGASEDNPSGLFYKLHEKIKLRELSPYIETANTNEIYGIPENSKFDLINNEWKWRDVYDHGYTDTDGFGTDFPFTNGQHYVKKDINFYLRNEDSFLNKRDGLKKFTEGNNDPLC